MSHLSKSELTNELVKYIVVNDHALIPEALELIVTMSPEEVSEAVNIATCIIKDLKSTSLGKALF